VTSVTSGVTVLETDPLERKVQSSMPSGRWHFSKGQLDLNLSAKWCWPCSEK
jgi:hypothetical protein